MVRTVVLIVLPVFSLVFSAGCLPQPDSSALQRLPEAVPHEPVRLSGDVRLTEDTFWNGSIVIDGTVHLIKGKTLTIAPGADIAFVRRDADQDGLGDAGLMIDGELVAVGTPAAPIRFHSAEAAPRPGDWLEIHVDFSPRIELRYCEIRHSAHGLHAHFTKGVVEDCVLAENIDGTRLGRSRFALRNNLIERNIGKGINFRDSRLEIRRNILRYNRVGIFLFEKDRDSLIQENNFYDNDLHLRLGDFFTGHLTLSQNWWQGAAAQEAASRIHDRGEDPQIGTVDIAPVDRWIAGSGPRDDLSLTPLWQQETGGFVDMLSAGVDDTLYVGSWDGTLRALDLNGSVLWTRPLGDVIDAAPAVQDDRLFVQTWGRRVYALGRGHGEILWQWSYPPSGTDDHRQGALMTRGDLLLVPAWNGTLYALSQDNGEPKWSLELGAALRAAPALDRESLWIGNTHGEVFKVGPAGEILCRSNLGGAVLTPAGISSEGPVFLTRDGILNALDQDGVSRWRTELDEVCFYAAPVLSGDAMFVATAGGSLWKIDTDNGAVLWRTRLSGPAYATPVVHGGRVYVGDNEGTLQVFNADSGALLVKQALPAAIQGGPAVRGESLALGARDGAVHLFRITPSVAMGVSSEVF